MASAASPAIAVPTLHSVAFDTARSHSGIEATAEAKSRFEEYSKLIATSVMASNPSHLVEFVISHRRTTFLRGLAGVYHRMGEQILGPLVLQENRVGEEPRWDRTRGIVDTDPTSTAAADAARWLVIMFKSHELCRFALTLTQLRGAVTVSEEDVADGWYFLALRARSKPYTEALFGELGGEASEEGEEEWLSSEGETEISAEGEEEQLSEGDDESSPDEEREGDDDLRRDEDSEELQHQPERILSEGGVDGSSARSAEGVAREETPAASENTDAAQSSPENGVEAGGSSSQVGTKRRASASDAPAAGGRAPLSSLINADAKGGMKKPKRRREC